MVNRLFFPLMLILSYGALGSTAFAAETLSVEPDSQQLYQGEVLTLTVRGTVTIDVNLRNLFDFDASSLPQPDIEKVEDDFDILGRNQRYSIQTVNGEMIGEVTWTYQLAPEKSGQLTIPSLAFRDARSDPVTVEVIDATPPQQSNKPRDSFIELSADKDTVYVQEQLVLSVKLFFNGNLIRGELSEPQHPNAIIESLGQQREYTRYRDGIRYRVVERRYAIFPQQPGELTLPALRFEGQTRDASGDLRFLRDSKRLFTVPVKEVPESFTGDTWLPANELTLSASGLPADANLETGQNLSRRLSVVAQGLPAETLPPFAHDMPPGMRAYPDNPERTTAPSGNGLTARLTQTTALVPVKGGEIVLPEIRIPWWDTDTDSQKIARIAARTFNVRTAPGQAASAEEPDNRQPPAQTAPAPAADDPGTQLASRGSWIWQTLAIVLLIGWAVTGFGWWYSRRSGATQQVAPPSPDLTEKALFTTLCHSARAGAPETPDHLLRWLQHCHPQRSVVSLGDAYGLLQDNELIGRETEKLQARAYGEQGGVAEHWDGEKLVSALEKNRAAMAKKTAAPGPLPPLYPAELDSAPGRD